MNTEIINSIASKLIALEHVMDSSDGRHIASGIRGRGKRVASSVKLADGVKRSKAESAAFADFAAITRTVEILAIGGEVEYAKRELRDESAAAAAAAAAAVVA